MTINFNLLSEPWIPCSLPSGERLQLSLPETISKAHEFKTIATASPLEAASILRLLLAVLHRVYDTTSMRKWSQVWVPGKFQTPPVDNYLHQWEQRFNLFSTTTPFYQNLEEEVEPKNVILLFPGASASPFYNHAVERSDHWLTPAEAARMVLVSQTFGLPGIVHPQKKLFMGGAPWVGGMVFFLEGENLFETLTLNMLRYDEMSPSELLNKNEDDRPAWEMDNPLLPTRELPLGYLDYLTWPNRRILLHPENHGDEIRIYQATFSPGLKIRQEIRDPMRHYHLDDKNNQKVLYLNPRRTLWRDSAALFSIRSAKHFPPMAFEWAASLAEEGLLSQNRFQIFSVGMSSDKAKANLFRSERLPVPSVYLQDETLVEKLNEALEAAEATRSSLWSACNQLATLMLSNEADLKDGRKPDQKDVRNLIEHWSADRKFWSFLELPFISLIDTLPGQDTDEAMEVWRKQLVQGAWEALDFAIRLTGDSPSALKAAVQARGFLGGVMRKKGLLPKQTQSMETA